MGYEKPNPRHDWRSKLTADEAREVRDIEALMEFHGNKKTELVLRLSPIRNRGIQRCRYEEKKEGQGA